MKVDRGKGQEYYVIGWTVDLYPWPLPIRTRKKHLLSGYVARYKGEK
jgi:hypothetical protein